MFQNLRSGMPFYILYKNEPRLAIGEVVSVGVPAQKFGTTYQNGILAPPRYEVDVKVNVSGEVVDLKQLPAEQSIADFGTTGMVVSESRESILNEVVALESISERALKDVDKHQRNVEEYSKIKVMLNPQLAKEVERSMEIEALKTDMEEIKGMLSKMLKQNAKS